MGRAELEIEVEPTVLRFSVMKGKREMRLYLEGMWGRNFFNVEIIACMYHDEYTTLERKLLM